MKIIRLVVGLFLAISFFTSSFIVAADNSGLILDWRTQTALKAAKLAAESMPGIYSWAEYRSCSSYASAYLRQLNFPVDGMQGQNADKKDPFPWSGVKLQVAWIKRNAASFVYDAPLVDFLNGKLWGRIKPGSVIYFQVPVGHNGFNTYDHVAMLIGYKTDGSPVFAEIVPGKPATYNRTFEELTGFYKKDANKNWIVIPYDTGTGEKVILKVTVFDAISYAEKYLHPVYGHSREANRVLISF